MQVELLKRVQDALDAITAVEGFLAHQSQDDFLSSDMLQAAVERKFEILGEALKKAADADESIEKHIPELRQIVATRNRIIHVYDAVDPLLLWDVVQTDLPGLKARLSRSSALPPRDRQRDLKKQKDEGAPLNQQIAEKASRLGYGF